MAHDRIEQERRKPSKRVTSSTAIADYIAVDANLLAKAIGTVALHGGALRLGYTSDGGAYSIGVYGDGDPYTDYVKPSEDFGNYLTRLIEAWET